MPYPEEGFWAPLDVIGVDAAMLHRRQLPRRVGIDMFYVALEFIGMRADINGSDKESEFGSSVVAKKVLRAAL